MSLQHSRMFEYPDTLWSIAQKIADEVEDANQNENVSKQDLVEALNPLTSLLMQKLVATPTATSFSLWRG